MKSLIVYSSQSGNTKKLAQAVYESLTGPKQMGAVGQAPDPAGYDVVALGFWLQAGKPDPASAKYLGKVGKKPLFLFATHGAAAGSDHVRNAMAAARSLASEAEIIGTYSCPGQVNPKVLEKAKNKPEPPVWIADAPNAAGHPDETDLAVLRHQIAQIWTTINSDR
jgi:flavodoxin